MATQLPSAQQSQPQRIDDPARIAELLQRLLDGSNVMAIRSADGTTVDATLWSHDPARGVMSFSADADDPRVQSLVEADDAVVTAELDGVVVRFHIDSLVLVRRGHDCAMSCTFPAAIERFHRRDSRRVRPVARTTAIARLHHPADSALRLVLRVLDVSTSGCALFMPDRLPPIVPDTRLAPVLIELDAETRLRAVLQVLHVTALHPRSRGVRLGCRLLSTPSEDAERLMRYVDQAQSVRPLIQLD